MARRVERGDGGIPTLVGRSWWRISRLPEELANVDAESIGLTLLNLMISMEIAGIERTYEYMLS